MNDSRKIELFNALMHEIDQYGSAEAAEEYSNDCADAPYDIWFMVLDAYKELIQ